MLKKFATLMIITASLLPTMVLKGNAQTSKLVIYTSQPERDAAQTIAGFKAVNPNVDVEIFRSGTTEIMSKLAAEITAGQPKPDILLIADSVSMEALKKDGRLMAYPEAKVDGFPQGSYDKDKTYFGSKLITTGVVYNTAAKLKPTSFADLAKPEYKGQVIMPSPLYSGAAAILLSSFAARQDLGWKYFEGLKSNDLLAVRGNGAVLKAVADGEKPYGILVDFMALNAKAKGSPVEFVFPTEGVTPVTEPVAILKTSSNPAAAKSFVDFILSPKGQELAVSQGYIPARAGVQGPSWLPEGTKINLMPIDTAAVLSTTEADKKRFADMFGN
jgi:iron(III) transport system substrate-binding protein